MNPDFQRLMQDATRLTRTGDLRGATAAIQAALHGSVAQPAPQPDFDRLPGGIVIDVEAREVPVGPQGTPGQPPGVPVGPAPGEHHPPTIGGQRVGARPPHRHGPVAEDGALGVLLGR